MALRVRCLPSSVNSARPVVNKSARSLASLPSTSSLERVTARERREEDEPAHAPRVTWRRFPRSAAIPSSKPLPSGSKPMGKPFKVINGRVHSEAVYAPERPVKNRCRCGTREPPKQTFEDLTLNTAAVLSRVRVHVQITRSLHTPVAGSFRINFTRPSGSVSRLMTALPSNISGVRAMRGVDPPRQSSSTGIHACASTER